MARRYPNPGLVKIHRLYTPTEIARLLGKHPNTIRNWIKDGLKPIDDLRCVLIRGREVRRYLEEKRASGKSKCPPGTLYCFGCKGPKPPAADMVDFDRKCGRVGIVTAICPDCSAVMKQVVSEARLKAFGLNVDFTN